MSRTPRPLYAELVSTYQALENCQKCANTEWADKHQTTIDWLEDLLPSGSGVDNGVKVEMVEDHKIIMSFGFHHMDENGFYDGWTDHKLILRPSLTREVDLTITGPDRNYLKEYLYDLFYHVMTSKVWQTEDGTWHSSLYEKVQD
jgi:hypothetical protein